jgi:hypothetical protein
MSRLRPSLAFLLAGGALAASQAAPAGLAADASGAPRFQHEIEHRTFDGLDLDVIRLVSAGVTLTTDNFGPWLMNESGESAGPFVLTHRRLAKVTVRIIPVAAATVPQDDDQWARYTTAVAVRLGQGTTTTDDFDSDDGAPAIAVLGWRTRESLFVAPGPIERAERHVFACGRSAGVLFILSGPRPDVVAAEGDFRFMLARLTLR